jgi:hypothetical protein
MRALRDKLTPKKKTELNQSVSNPVKTELQPQNAAIEKLLELRSYLDTQQDLAQRKFDANDFQGAHEIIQRCFAEYVSEDYADLLSNNNQQLKNNDTAALRQIRGNIDSLMEKLGPVNHTCLSHIHSASIQTDALEENSGQIDAPHEAMQTVASTEEPSTPQTKNSVAFFDQSPHRPTTPRPHVKRASKQIHLSIEEQYTAALENTRRTNINSPVLKLIQKELIASIERLKAANVTNKELILELIKALNSTHLRLNGSIDPDTFKNIALTMPGKPSSNKIIIGSVLMAFGLAIGILGFIFAPALIGILGAIIGTIVSQTVITASTISLLSITSTAFIIGAGVSFADSRQTGLSLAMTKLHNSLLTENVTIIPMNSGLDTLAGDSDVAKGIQPEPQYDSEDEVSEADEAVLEAPSSSLTLG